MIFQFLGDEYRIGFKHTPPEKGLKPGDKGYSGTTEAFISILNRDDKKWDKITHPSCGDRSGVALCGRREHFNKEQGREIALDRLLLADDYHCTRARSQKARDAAWVVRNAIIRNSAYTPPFMREFRSAAWLAYYGRVPLKPQDCDLHPLHVGVQSQKSDSQSGSQIGDRQ